ncbi:MAG: Na(+)-translocating NADH-quinone reductase subunit A [Bacteroidales bacterium]|nr:Na(+)-translocating NADH-quinone reductase subunit A [Bacteroidales bacterium]
MTNVIKLKKGLDINLKGKPQEKMLTAAKSDYFVMVPDDFYGVVPKVVVKAGDKVLAGTPLMFDKNRPEIKFVSPVSGEVTAVERGERRKVLGITVKKDETNSFVEFGKKEVSKISAEDIKTLMLESGVWPFIKQRPYDVIADPRIAPRDIFVSAFDSAPLAPEFEFVAKNEQAAIQAGLDALKKLTKGKVYVGVRPGSAVKMQGVEVVTIEGPHPAGNAGVQAHNIKPVNKGETIWTLSAFDLVIIGRLFTKGVADFSRIVAVTGSEISTPAYVNACFGTCLKDLLSNNVVKADYAQRFISGNVLSGINTGLDGYLNFYHSQITVIPDGSDNDEFVGWALPGLAKYSTTRTYLTWLFGGKKEYTIDARLRGGKRALIVSGQFEKFFPMDIYPEFLYKATLAFDIDKMENLGIYEVAPEDFAVCEFVDVSKTEIQKVIRLGLDRLQKEMN